MKLLEIKDLYAEAENKKILQGLSLTIEKGQTHVIMGPNGAGKSTLASVILNSPAYKKTAGEILLCGNDITNVKTEEIAKDVFMSFQTPEEIEGISVLDLITAARNARGQNTFLYEVKKEALRYAKTLKISEDKLTREFNVGFSGGEKKKNEILQMLMLRPKLAILDETDSGLDVDAVRTVSKGIKLFKNEENAVLIITHSTKILEKLSVDKVHILMNGRIVQSGDASLAQIVEKEGYDRFRGANGKE